MPFVSTVNKDVIRRVFDKPIIEDEYLRRSKPLTYFGLPGPEMLDVLEWKDYLGSVIAVEREMYARHFMRTKAFKEGYSVDRFQILAGHIDDIILKGEDLNGVKPKEVAFDLINLDYEGGLLYKDLNGESKRLKAIKKLFDMQREEKRDFVLILTVNTRNSDWGEFDRTLEDMKDELGEYGVNASETADWHRRARYDYKIKAYLPYVFNDWARANRFLFKGIHAVTYLGSNNRRMVHFATVFACGDGTMTELRKGHSLISILNLPLYEAVNGKIRKCKVHPPELSIEETF